MAPDSSTNDNRFEITVCFPKVPRDPDISGPVASSPNAKCPERWGLVGTNGDGWGWFRLVWCGNQRGLGGGWVLGDWVCTWGLLGMMGEGVHYSYHKQCPQFSEGVYGPTSPAPNSTISLLRGSDAPQKTAMFIVLVDVLMKTFFEEACHGCSDFRWRVADHLLKEDFHG